MNAVINNILKQINKLKGNWGFVGKLTLGVLILSLSACYLVWRFPSIVTGGEKQIDTAFIAVSAIIILLPFLSEIELFGVKFKKEIEEVKKEILKDVEYRLSIKNQTSIVNNFNQNIDEIEKNFNKVKMASQQNGNKTLQIPKQLLSLLELRNSLSSMISLLYGSKKGVYFDNYKVNLYDRALLELEFLTKDNVLSNNDAELIKEVLDICQDVSEGREVDVEAIRTAIDSEKDIMSSLRNIYEEIMINELNKKYV